MKKLISCLFVVILCSAARAQVISTIANAMRNTPSHITEDAMYQKGKSYINVGIGFPNLFFKASDITGSLSNLFSTKKRGFVTTMATYEYAIKENLGIGLLLGYAQGEYRYVSNTDANSYIGFKGTFYNIGFLSNYHIHSDKVCDIYTGAILVYNGKKITPTGNANVSINIPFLGNISVADFINKPTAPDLLYQLSIGARVFPFNAKPIGLFAELGYGITIIKLGLATKF